MTHTVVIQRPAAATYLMLLFHGVGATAEHLAPLGQRLAEQFPNAFIVSVAGSHTSDLGAGRQWFSVRGITEDNRRHRVETAMPRFLAAIAEWQHAANIDPERTMLIGFSQGAIMALESTRQTTATAERVVSIAGRFSDEPQLPSHPATVHLLHGEEDGVIPYQYSVTAAQQLTALGVDVTLDVVPSARHEISAHIEDLLISRLKEIVPQRRVQAAMQGERKP